MQDAEFWELPEAYKEANASCQGKSAANIARCKATELNRAFPPASSGNEAQHGFTPLLDTAAIASQQITGDITQSCTNQAMEALANSNAIKKGTVQGKIKSHKPKERHPNISRILNFIPKIFRRGMAISQGSSFAQPPSEKGADDHRKKCSGISVKNALSGNIEQPPAPPPPKLPCAPAPPMNNCPACSLCLPNPDPSEVVAHILYVGPARFLATRNIDPEMSPVGYGNNVLIVAGQHKGLTGTIRQRTGTGCVLVNVKPPHGTQCTFHGNIVSARASSLYSVGEDTGQIQHLLLEHFNIKHGILPGGPTTSIGEYSLRESDTGVPPPPPPVPPRAPAPKTSSSRN